MKKRVWRIRIERQFGFDAFVSHDFPTFEAADKERKKLQRKKDFKKAKLSVVPDPPMPHKFLDIA